MQINDEGNIDIAVEELEIEQKIIFSKFHQFKFIRENFNIKKYFQNDLITMTNLLTLHPVSFTKVKKKNISIPI